MRTLSRLLVVILWLFCGKNVLAQNLEKIGKEDMVTVSGAMSLNTIAYFSDGQSFAGRDPLTWYAAGSLTVNFLEVSLPFTYSYSNRRGRFSQPFNMAALHPKYKWVQAHGGVTSMSFSPYSLAGHVFAGGGLDLTPGKWKISLMGGRLNKAIQYDPVVNNVNEVTYRRIGYGVKVGYESGGHSLHVIGFKAKDDPTSLTMIPNNTDVKPQDNAVFSVIGKTTLVKNLTLNGEYALSGLTQNLENTEDFVNTAQSASLFGNLLVNNGTTDFYSAYNAALAYKFKKMNLAIKFEHIDPNYKTLGGYYFNNDLENYTLAPSFTLFKSKVNLGLNAGFQRNNLNGDKSATTKRWIGSINTSVNLKAGLSINGSYSNFSTFTKNRPTTDPFYFDGADTLNFYQVSQNASAGFVYAFGKNDAEVGKSVQGMYNFMESMNVNGALSSAGAFGANVDEVGVPIYVHGINAAYAMQFKTSKTNLSMAFNANQTEAVGTTSLFYGPSVNVSKPLLGEKVKFGVGSTYNRNMKDAVLSNHILNHRLSLTHSPKLKNEQLSMNLSLNGNFLQKLPTVASEVAGQEVNVFVNLSVGF
jgi:hypothetical protein